MDIPVDGWLDPVMTYSADPHRKNMSYTCLLTHGDHAKRNTVEFMGHGETDREAYTQLMAHVAPHGVELPPLSQCRYEV